MFTGIIECVGRIEKITRRAGSARARIACGGLGSGLSTGDSIAVDGVCLTVVARGTGWFESDISPETARRSTLGGARRGMRINVERPLAASGRLGGHFVQGHVDATGKVAGVAGRGGFLEMSISYPASLRGLLVEKGSIAVNGVSLTIAGLDRGAFKVALIPHTLKVTNLSALGVGDAVNLEADILAKYVRALLDR